MTGIWKVIGAAVLAGGLGIALAAPAAAQDRGNEAVTSGGERAATQRRARVTVYPRSGRLSPSARRHCEAWLVREYRVSGPVIVPRQRCWWQ